jgi:hypothetical protein
MLVIGGTFPDDQNCDSPNVMGTHNIDLGSGNSSKKWAVFDPASPPYLIPPELVMRIGGS